MAGIMIPITMSQGVQRAREDNQNDDRYAMDLEYNQRRLEGLDLSQRRDRMAMDEMEKGAPLRELQRKAQMTSEMAKQAYTWLANGHPELGQVPDDQIGGYMAKVLSDTPVFGEVKVQPDGSLSDGKRNMKMDRQTALKMLAGLADPEKAMELAQQEQQYINENGKVETMTAGEAQSRGLEMAADKMSGYGLHKAQIEDMDAEENARLGIAAKKAQIAASNRAHREKPDDMQFVSPDGKTVKTMGRSQGLEMGWTPYGDYTATRKLQGLGEDGYDFSPQSPGSVEGDAYDAYLADMGYQFNIVKDEFGTPVKQLTKGGKAAEISPEDHTDAREYARLVNNILASGEAKSIPAARELAARKLAPPVEGAKKAPDGKWYVQTGTKPDGKPIWAPVYSAGDGQRDTAGSESAPQASDPGYGPRNDGTRKGRGYFGEIPTTDGKVMTELGVGVEIDGKEVEIPLLVPTLTREEISLLASGQRPSPSVMKKAIDHAMARMRQGKSPFAQDGEQIK